MKRRKFYDIGDMKILILAAMDKEKELLLLILDGAQRYESAGLEYHMGKVGGHDVAVAKCGIGKVNSALRCHILIEEIHPDMVINSGVAGGADASMKIGSVLVADRVAYHDVWCGPGTDYGAADGLPQIMEPDSMLIATAKSRLSGNDVRYGLICSGDKFISKGEEVAEIKSHFPEALACDMESASIAQTCILHGIPFGIVRVVSDTPGQGENISQYKNFWSEAPAKTFHTVETIIENL